MRPSGVECNRPTGVIPWAGGRSFQASPHRFDHFLLIRELAGFELGVNQLTVERQLEAAAAAGDKLQFLDLLLVRRQDLARQTDGFGLIASGSAVFDLDNHVILLIGQNHAPTCILRPAATKDDSQLPNPG